MAKKSVGFQWTREDQRVEADSVGPAEVRNTRVAEKAHTRDLQRLARRLTAMPAGLRAKLPLDAKLLEEIAILSRLGPKSSRRRQLLYVQGLLRGSDLDGLEAAMEGETDDAALARSMERWRTQLLAGGDAELQAYLADFPGGDRQQLRNLIRRSRGQGDGARKASRRLFRILMQLGS
jgi:ribosome-associated protein